MLARRYEAATLDQAMALVRQDLGSEAVVLYSRGRVGPWWRSWLGSAEVIAMAPPATVGDGPASPHTGPSVPSTPHVAPPVDQASPDRVVVVRGAPIRMRTGSCRRVALIGATGAGKTTTAAKIASRCARRGFRIGLIAADGFRMGAAAQLDGYARVLRVPCIAAPEAGAAARATARLARTDLVLVDCPGVALGRSERMDATRAILDAVAPHETYLVVSATSQPDVIAKTQQALRNLGATRLILTHVDETPPAALWAVLGALSLPLSYLGSGPEPPGHLISARARAAEAWLSPAHEVRSGASAVDRSGNRTG